MLRSSSLLRYAVERPRYTSGLIYFCMIVTGSIFAIFVIKSDKIFGSYINFVVGSSIIALLCVSFLLRVLEISKCKAAFFSDNSIFHNSKLYIMLNGSSIALLINTSIILLLISIFIEVARLALDESVIAKACEEATICQYITLVGLGSDKNFTVAEIMAFYFFVSITISCIGYALFLILLLKLEISYISIDEYHLLINFRILLIAIVLFLISMISLFTIIDEYYFISEIFPHENYSIKSIPFFIKLWAISTMTSAFLYALFAQVTTFAFLMIRWAWSMGNE